MVEKHVVPQSEAVPPPFLKEKRMEIEEGFKQFAELISNVRKPLPTQTGNGSDIEPKEDSPAIIKKVEGGLKDLWHRGISGSISDISTLLEVQQKNMTGELIDDKTYLMERLIKVAAELPDGSALSKTVTDSFLTQLWNDLQHPPQSYLGGQYQYRSADGSFNSLIHPDLGKANTPYARTVQPRTMRSGAPPDPEVVFDSVMVRKHRDKHPNGVSSVLFYLATIIIHDLFRTDHSDFTRSTTSSYLDLSPLYGCNIDEQKSMRLAPKVAKGHIKPDCFAEKRLLTFPPGVGVLLIMFNRFHNHVVDQLALINEGNRFPNPGENGTDKQWETYDEDLFQTARLITSGLYINIILIDYVRTILNLNKTDSNWQLNPRVEIKNGPPMGIGNQVSAEFNLVYRWHSTISDRDEKWTNELFDELFPGEDPATMDWHDFVVRVSKLQKDLSDDPLKRDFHHIPRNEDGTLPEDTLVKIMTDSIEDCANAFGANRVPPVMRVIEVLGIKQARVWNCATLNEFRKHFGLAPHKTFEDINSDVEVAEQLRRLYDHPDLVELYPGMVVEEAKVPLVPGSGLCPPYAISRGVLSDAVAVVRGDRFYTVDYHPRKLTNWGFSEVKSDLDIDNGCMFFKLFLRAFPRHFAVDSVYAHYPMTIPPVMEKTLTTLKKAHKYTFLKPARIPESKMVLSYSAADQVLADHQLYAVTWDKAIEFLMGESTKDFMIAKKGNSIIESRKILNKALYVDGWEKQVRTFYENTTAKLLKTKAYRLAGSNQVDIIRDIGNIAHVHFCAEMFTLPLKTEQHPQGVFTEHELYLLMTSIFTCIFADLDPANSFPLRQKTFKATQVLAQLVESHVSEVQRGGLVSWVSSFIQPQNSPLKDYGKPLIERLLSSGIDVKELVWGNIIGTASGIVAAQAQLFGQIIEYFLGEGKEHLPAIQKLAKRPDDDQAAFDTLLQYTLEACRLNAEPVVFRQATADTTIVDGGRKVEVKKGDKILVNLRSASHDPEKFPEPDKLKLDRPKEAYLHLGDGLHQFLGIRMTGVALTSMLRIIGRLNNLRPVKGPQGQVAKVVRSFDHRDSKISDSGHYHRYLTENWDMYFPFPCSLKVNWDGDVAGGATTPVPAISTKPAGSSNGAAGEKNGGW